MRADGTISCWGNDEDGQSTPPSGTFASVSAGVNHSCGVRADGNVACWGGDPDNYPRPLGYLPLSVLAASRAAGYVPTGLLPVGDIDTTVKPRYPLGHLPLSVLVLSIPVEYRPTGVLPAGAASLTNPRHPNGNLPPSVQVGAVHVELNGMATLSVGDHLLSDWRERQYRAEEVAKVRYQPHPRRRAY